MPTIADLPLFGADETAPSSYDSVSDIQAVYRDPRFRSDLREYYASKGVGSSESDEELIDRFFSDGNWRDLNTVGALQALGETATQSDRMQLVTARLQQVWDRQPAFYQEGGRGLAAVPDIAKALVLDPVNLLGGGGGMIEGAKAARATYAAGKGLSEAVSAGMRSGAMRGALIEGGINAGQEAVVDTALQQRNVELGLQDEVNQTQTALGAGTAGLIGGGLGGLMGGVAGRGAAGAAVRQAEDLVSRGLTRADIGSMSAKQLDELASYPPTVPASYPDQEFNRLFGGQTIENRLEDFSPERRAAAAQQMERDRLAAEAARAAQQASADDLEVKYAGHLAAIDRAIEEHRKVLDDYRADGFHELSDADPNKSVYRQHEEDLANVTALRDTLEKLRAEEEQIRAPQGSNVVADDKTAMQRRMLFEQRFSDFRRSLEEFRDPDQINADILARAEQIRQQRNVELDAEAAADAPKPRKAKVDPQGKKAATATEAAPAQAATPAAPQAAAPQAAAPAAPAPAPAAAAPAPAQAAPTPAEPVAPAPKPTSPAEATPAGEAAAAPPQPPPGAAAAPTSNPEAPNADGIVITNGARERMSAPDMNVDENDFLDWYKNGAVGWSNKDKVNAPNRITAGAVSAYKRAIRKGQWVGNAVAKTAEEQPNRLEALLSAEDPYSTNFRQELESLVNETAKATDGLSDPKLFREIFEALSTDPKLKSKRDDFMLFLDESYKAHGISADMLEGIAADAKEASPTPLSDLTGTERKRMRTLAKAYQEQGMDPAAAMAKAAETVTASRAVQDTPLPRDAQGNKIQPGKFQNQKDRMTTQSAIRREGIFETAGRNWNNNKIADMLRMGVATKRVPTSEEFWRTKGDTYVTESINTSGLKRGEDKFLDPKQFDRTSARVKGEENVKANAQARKYSEEYGNYFKRFNDRITNLLMGTTLAPRELRAGDLGLGEMGRGKKDVGYLDNAAKRAATMTNVPRNSFSGTIENVDLVPSIDPKRLDQYPPRYQITVRTSEGLRTRLVSQEEGAKLKKGDAYEVKLTSDEAGTLIRKRIELALKSNDPTVRARAEAAMEKFRLGKYGFTDEEVQADALNKLADSRTAKTDDGVALARKSAAENQRIEEISKKALDYTSDPEANVDGMAQLLGIELLPKPPKGADEVTRARMNKERKDDPAYNDVLQILNAGKKAAKAKALQAQTGGPEIIPYEVTSPETIYKGGERVTVNSGTIWYDARQQRAFSNFEEAVASRNGLVPITEADKKSYLRQFLDSYKKSGRLEVLRMQLDQLARGDFTFKNKTPKGMIDAAGNKLYIMLAKKSDLEKRSTRPRKLSKAQYEAAQDGKDGLSALLGKANLDDFEIRYTTNDTMPKNNAQMWKLWDAAAPVNKIEQVMEVYGNRTSRSPLSYDNYATKRITSISDDEAEALVFASQIGTGKKRLPYESVEQVKAAAGAGKLPMHVIEMAENALAYVAPISTSKDGMLGILKHMAALNRIREREAPMGFVMPAVAREESVKQLQSLIAGYPSEVVTQLETMLRRLGGSRGESPIFKAFDDAVALQKGTVGRYTLTADGSILPENSIRLASPSQIAQVNRARQSAGKTSFNDFVGGRSHPVATLAHEMFHWAWKNILNPTDRLEFIEGLTRQLYDAEGNLLPVADQLPPLANSLQSVNEVGANLFSQWVIRNRSDRLVMGEPNATTKELRDRRTDRWLAGLDTVFTKFKEHLLGIIDRYFHHQPLDPALEAKFAKILPDDRLLAFRDGRGTPPDTFGPKAKFAEKIEQRYKEFRLVKRDLEDAFVSKNPEQILRASVAVSNYFRSIAVNATRTGIFSPVKPWFKIIHERNKELTFLLTGRRLPDDILDEIEKLVTPEGKLKAKRDVDDADVGEYAPIGAEHFDYINPDDVISGKARLKGVDKPTLDDRVSAMNSDIMDLVASKIQEIYFDGNPFLRTDAPPPNPKFSLKYAFDQIERSFEGAHVDLFGTLPKGSAPSILGEIESVSSASAATRAQRSAKATDAQFGSTMAEILDARNFDHKATGPEPDMQAAGNIKDQSIVQLTREWPRVKGTPRGKEIMVEVKRRFKAEPFPPERVAVPKTLLAMNNEQLNDTLFTALREGGPDNAKLVSQAAHEIHRRAANELNVKNKLPKFEAITADAREAISREREDNTGVAADIGIPANARATVREALSYVTDRNPEHAYVARTMMYRLYNLMGKTVRATVEDSNLMSMAELSRLAGVEPGAGATGMVVDFRSPAFKQLRRDVRRFAIGLNRQTATPIDLMHEIGHIIVRGVLSDTDRSSILDFYRAANDQVKNRVQSAYGAKYSHLAPNAREERLAHEWFAESWAQWSAERVSRGDILSVAESGRLADLTARGKIDTIIDRLTEYVAYLVNGLIGRDDVKQMFRRLTFYGDMFDTRRPLSVADAYGDNFAVPSHIAADYVDESLFRNKARLEKMQDFVRGTEGEDANGNPVVMYHATPNGYRLRKDKNPDAILRPSTNGKYGPGTYLTFNPTAAEKVYAEGTPRSLLAMIEDSDLDEAVADDLIDLVEVDLNNVRKQIRYNVGELTTLRSEADKIADTDEGNANSFLLRDDTKRLEKQLAALYRQEKAILDTLERNGISPDGVVLPLVTNAKRLANFSEKMRYEPDDPFVTALVDRVQSYFPASAAESANAYATFTSLGSILNGKALHDRLITMATKNGISTSQAKVVVQNALKELGYDGMRATFVDRVVRDAMPEEITHEGALIFETAKLKHVDADEFDPMDDRMYLRALTDTPVSPMGRIVGAIIEDNVDGFNSAIVADAMEAAEAAGVSPRLVDSLRSMVGGRNLTPSEFRTKASAATMLLGSQSKRMTQDGMKWLASRYEDFFPSVSVEFAKHFYPVLEQLRSLPGTDSVAGRWVRRSFGTLPGVGQRLGKQPVAYAKIVKALRRGQGTPEWSSLSAQERAAAQAVRDTFTSVRELLIKSGDSVGLRANYFPQIWNAEKVAANREAFIEAAVRYFETERLAEGVEVNREELRAIAEKVAMKLTDEDADRYFPPQIRSSNAKAEHLDYSRLFQLEKFPGHLKDFEQFLEDDLEAIVTKYLDGAARRLVQNERFGNGVHMFNDYILAATEGVDGIAELLGTPKVYRKEFKALQGGEMRNALFELEVGMPFQSKPEEAKVFAEGLVKTFQTSGRAGAEKALMELSEKAPKTYVRRVEAILGALEDFGGQPAMMDARAIEQANQSMRLLVGQPLTNPAMGGKTAHNVSKNLRAFNSITLLSFATLTSLTDIALPIIRSGEFKSWYRGLKQMAQDPEYRQLMRNIGVAIESEVHQHLSTLYGTHNAKHANAFFNATMLTPWTNVQRKIAAATGFEAMKTMQQKAFRTFKEGVDITKQPAEYRTAHRFLTRYGLQDYLPGGAMKNISLDQQLLAESDEFKLAVVKFADEAIFSPNPNDIPLWAQTPLGSIVFQFKAYPLMMGRMSKWVLDEARQGNYKPLAYMATIAPGLGAASLAIKDLIQMRGGEDNNEAKIRNRNLQKWLGYDEKVHGNIDDFAGWYIESMLASGGFGFLAEMLHDVASQVDNGAYGKTRIYGTIGGPSVGTFSSAIDVLAGAQSAIMGGGESNSKERAGVREVARRIPVLGGVSAFREGATDTIAGPKTERGTGGWNSDWKGWE